MLQSQLALMTDSHAYGSLGACHNGGHAERGVSNASWSSVIGSFHSLAGRHQVVCVPNQATQIAQQLTVGSTSRADGTASNGSASLGAHSRAWRAIGITEQHYAA